MSRLQGHAVADAKVAAPLLEPAKSTEGVGFKSVPPPGHQLDSQVHPINLEQKQRGWVGITVIRVLQSGEVGMCLQVHDGFPGRYSKRVQLDMAQSDVDRGSLNNFRTQPPVLSWCCRAACWHCA